MNLRYSRHVVLAVAILVAASSALAANLVVEPTLPSSGSMVFPGSPGAPAYTPGQIQELTPGLDGPAIECNNFDTNPVYTGFYNIPPDPYVAAGPGHVLNVTNTILEWRAKAGINNTPQYQNSFQAFFAGTPGFLGTTCFDPKVIYDQYNGRFVIVVLERLLVAQGAASNQSRILVAVSKTSDPNAGWWRFAINSLLNINGTDHWADFPGIGCDDKAVYITNNMFSVTSPFPGVGSRLWIINKTPTYSGPDGNVAFNVYNAVTAAGGVQTTHMPTHMFGALPNGTLGRPLGTYLVAYSGLNDGGAPANEAIQFVEVTDPLSTMGGPYFHLAQVLVGNIDSNSGQNDATQLGTTRRIETNDRRCQNAVWRSGQIFLAANCMPAAGADFGEVTAHWWRFACPGAAASIVLSDQGNAGAEDLGADTYTFFPLVQVDANLNMAIGFAASNGTIYTGAYYATRNFTDAAGTVGGTVVLAAGVASYIRTFTSSTTATSRWGDYSGLALDPTDECSFWVYNEYAGTQGSPTTVSGVTENGRWQTKLGKFNLCQSVSVAITSFDAVARDAGVELSGAFASNLDVQVVNVYRGGVSGPMVLIDAVTPDDGDFAFTDRNVTPGSSYRYQIGVVDADGEFFSAIATVSLESLAAAVAQNNPNPFNPSTTIRFTVAEAGHVALNVYDASGQLVRTLVDGVRESGMHDVTWDGRDNGGAPVGSGVYFYRYTAGKFNESKKMVLLK